MIAFEVVNPGDAVGSRVSPRFRMTEPPGIADGRLAKAIR
jgi:hypothetical protein